MFWNRIIGPSNDGCVQASIFAHSGQVWRTIAGYEAIQNDPQRPSVPECDGCEGLSVAWLLAREETGQRTTYRTESGREALLKNPDFVAAFQRAKNRIASMKVAFVVVQDDTVQYLVEVFATVSLKARFNSLRTT